MGALAIAGASVFARLAGDTERITNYRTSAELDDTAPVILEETAARVVQRASELPKSMLQQLLLSARS